MPYGNRVLVERILAQTMTSSSPSDLDQPVDLISIGNSIDSGVISDSIVNQYLQWADSEIDSILSGLYTTPLTQQSDYETSLLVDISEYNPYLVTEAGAPLHIGDIIVLNNGFQEEVHTISNIVDELNNNIFETDTTISFSFLSGTRVIRIKYPDPIPLISSRYAAANIYEKYFMAEASPAKSEYGNLLRKMAKSDLNNVLDGKTILHGVHRIGRRFYNSNLVDRYSLKGNIGDNKLDEIS